MFSSTTLPGKTAIQLNEIEALRSVLRGKVVAAGDADYDGTRRLWNGMIETRPDWVGCSA